MEDLLKYLLEHNRQLSEQVVELSKAIVELTRPNVTIPNVNPFYVGDLPQLAGSPWSMSEFEEDARLAHANGLMTQADLEDILRQAEFDNSEVGVDLEP